MIPSGDPTHSTVGEENVRQRMRRECDEHVERGMQPVPAKYLLVRVSTREMK